MASDKRPKSRATKKITRSSGRTRQSESDGSTTRLIPPHLARMKRRRATHGRHRWRTRGHSKNSYWHVKKFLQSHAQTRREARNRQEEWRLYTSANYLPESVKFSTTLPKINISFYRSRFSIKLDYLSDSEVWIGRWLICRCACAKNARLTFSQKLHEFEYVLRHSAVQCAL